MPEDRYLSLQITALACQAVFGAVGLFGLILAAVYWGRPLALAFAIAACTSEVASLSFGMRSLATGSKRAYSAALGLWFAVFALGLCSFASLI